MSNKELLFYTDGKRHLVCFPFSKENLFLMADELGIKHCWFHNSKTLMHFDIPKRRISEIEQKCQMISSAELISIIRGNNPGLV